MLPKLRFPSVIRRPRSTLAPSNDAFKGSSAGNSLAFAATALGIFAALLLLLLLLRSRRWRPARPSLRSRSSDFVDIDATEAEALDSMKAHLDPGTCEDDATLLRFLRARNFQVDAALAQYREAQRWRQDNRVGRYRDEAPAAPAHAPVGESGAVECFPQLRVVAPLDDLGARFYYGLNAFFGSDRKGRPIYIQKVGLASGRFDEAYRHFGDGDKARDALVAGWVWCQEVQAARAAEATERLGRPVAKQLVLMDLEGLNYWPDPRAISIFKDFLLVIQRYYPETLGALVFVNAPMIFTALWRMIRGWLDPETARKVQIYGSNFEAKLRELVEPSQLLREYGGTNDFDLLSKPRSLAECQECMAEWLASAEQLRTRGTTPARERTSSR
mmetsp:Transcript_7854/g.25924  ORF Transcript_7854/g.25924 Transcript_7854/m.25924 type:complete len:387 (-) Transcript_7854:223-1383(-)